MMNKQEKAIVQNCVKRIKQLSSLERAKFSCNEEKDKKTKDTIRPYMTWFDIVADELEELVALSEKKDNYFKKQQLNDLESRSYRL